MVEEKVVSEKAKEIGERIKACRDAQELSQKALANFLGKSRAAVAQWEGGHSLPSVEALADMANVLHVPAEYLAFGIDTRRTTNYLIPLIEYHGSTSKLAQIGSVALDEDMMSSFPTNGRTHLKSIISPNAVEGHISNGDRLVFDTSKKAIENLEGTNLFVLWRETGPMVAEVTSSFDNAEQMLVKVGRNTQPVSRKNMNVLGRVLTRTESLI